jgi:hypothetical protein
MKCPGPSFVVGTSNASQKRPCGQCFFHFGWIRMKHPPGLSFLVGTSNARRGPADNAFLPFWLNQPGWSTRDRPLLLEHPTPARRGPADNPFFHSSSLQQQVPSSLPLCWQVANYKVALSTPLHAWHGHVAPRHINWSNDAMVIVASNTCHSYLTSRFIYCQIHFFGGDPITE